MKVFIDWFRVTIGLPPTSAPEEPVIHRMEHNSMWQWHRSGPYVDAGRPFFGDSRGEFRFGDEHLVKVEAKCTWNDQGWGNRKGQIWLQLGTSGQKLDLFGIAPHKRAVVSCVKTERDDPGFFNAIRAGDEVTLMVVVGGGGGHKLTVKNLSVALHLQPFGVAVEPELSLSGPYPGAASAPSEPDVPGDLGRQPDQDNNTKEFSTCGIQYSSASIG